MLYIQSIIVYTLLTLLMCYGAYRSQGNSRSAKLWGWVPIILFTLVFGLRYGVGVDYNNYLEIYEETEYYETFSQILDNERYEPGFSLLLYICHYCNAPVYVLFIIIAFLQIFLLYKTYKEENNILIFIYITLIFTGYCMYNFMNILRHEIAFCFFLYSIRYIRDNKLIKYWICCLLALSFHHSAIFLFPLYFIWVHKKSILNQPYIELIILVICFVGSSFISPWQDLLHKTNNFITLFGYEYYIDIANDMVMNTKIGITRLLNLIVNCIIIINSKKIKEYFHNSTFNILYDLFFFGTCMDYLFMESMLLQRLFLYFSHTKFIVLAYALSYFYSMRQKHMQLISYSFIVLFIFVSYSSFIYHCKENTGAYVTYFQTELHTEKDNLRDLMMDNQIKPK